MKNVFFFLFLMFFGNLVLGQSGTDANAPMVQEEQVADSVYVDDIKRIQEAFNQSEADSNIIIYRYDAKNTYKIRLRSFMTSVIHLPSWEEVHAFTLGDSHIFSFQVLSDKKNIGIIQNKFAGADSNLTIIGKSGNIYNFYIRVDNVKSSFLPQNVVYIQAPQPKTPALPKQKLSHSVKKGQPANVSDYLRAIDSASPRQLETRQDLDFRYVIYINEDMIPPTKVFSDGYWTYFKIGSEKNLDKIEDDLPALFMVNSEGAEVPANIRVVNGYLIAEQTGKAWVLRQGEKYLCIQKDIYNQERNFEL